MLTSSCEEMGDWDEKCEEEIVEDGDYGETVFQGHNSTPPKSLGKLKDLFDSTSKPPISLTGVFNKPESEGHLKSKDLFGLEHNTMTKNRLSDIMATLDLADNSPSWPVEPSNADRYPVDIDFIDDECDGLELPSMKMDHVEMEHDAHLHTGPIASPKSSRYIVADQFERTPKISKEVSNFTNGITCLDLAFQQLNSIKAYTLDKIPYTRYRLNNNQLEYVDDVMPSAQLLYASNNWYAPIDGSLSGMTCFSHLRALSVLDISHNKISDLSGTKNFTFGLSSLSCLKELKIADNFISDLIPITKLQNLVYLDLQNNNIEIADFSTSSLPRLYTLCLGGNSITAFEHPHTLKYLHELYLEENSLTEFIIDKPMSKLRILNLNDNSLTNFDAKCCPALTALHLDRNSVSRIDGLPFGMSLVSVDNQESSDLYLMNNSRVLSLLPLQVEEVRISGNNQMDWTTNFGVDLESLDAAECILKSIPVSVSCCIKLQQLCLSFNDISDISPVANLINLRVLLIAHNKLSDLNSATCALRKLRNLSVLDVRDNLFIPRSNDSTKLEVAEIVMHTGFIYWCKKLTSFNEDPVTETSRKNARRRMSILQQTANRRRNHAANSDNEMNNWKPELYPLNDMTEGDDLVLQILDES